MSGIHRFGLDFEFKGIKLGSQTKFMRYPSVLCVLNHFIYQLKGSERSCPEDLKRYQNHTTNILIKMEQK